MVSDRSGKIHNMVSYAYFSAPDDESAASTLLGGPDPALCDVIDVKGLDPVVVIGRLEGLLRGIGYEAATALPRRGDLVSAPDAEDAWVVTVTDTLQDSLADATDTQLTAVSVPWSQVEEFRGTDTGGLIAFLHRFATLAGQARERDHHLYCHISL